MIPSLSMSDVLLITPAGITNGATSAANQDCIGSDWASIRVALSNIAQATIASADGATVKLQESDDTQTTNFVSIAGFSNITALKLAQEVRLEVDLRSRKRYLRLSIIPGTSGVTNEPLSAAAFVTLSRKEQAPASTTAMVAGTNDHCVIG